MMSDTNEEAEPDEDSLNGMPLAHAWELAGGLWGDEDQDRGKQNVDLSTAQATTPAEDPAGDFACSENSLVQDFKGRIEEHCVEDQDNGKQHFDIRYNVCEPRFGVQLVNRSLKRQRADPLQLLLTTLWGATGQPREVRTC